MNWTSRDVAPLDTHVLTLQCCWKNPWLFESLSVGGHTKQEKAETLQRNGTLELKNKTWRKWVDMTVILRRKRRTKEKNDFTCLGDSSHVTPHLHTSSYYVFYVIKKLYAKKKKETVGPWVVEVDQLFLRIPFSTRVSRFKRNRSWSISWNRRKMWAITSERFVRKRDYQKEVAIALRNGAN